MRPLTLAWKPMISADRHQRERDDAGVKASRSPRNANWRGRNPSRARNEERRGKSAKLVLAASTRMSAVATWATIRTAPSPVSVSDQEAQDRLLARSDPAGSERGEQVRDPQEQDGEDDRPPRSAWSGVLPLRRLERGHPVADRLDAGQRHRSLAERAQDEEEAERLGSLLDLSHAAGGTNVGTSPNVTRSDRSR